MATSHGSPARGGRQATAAGLSEELADLFAVLRDGDLIGRLREYRWTGRRGFDLVAMWHSVVMSYYLGLPSLAAMVRYLQDNPTVAYVCGFDLGRPIPHRSTFSRFFSRLAKHAVLIEEAISSATDDLHSLIPDLGNIVAVDSTTFHSHSNPNRRNVSDPDASWTAKAANRNRKGETEWHWGYKAHLLVDAVHELPIGVTITTASRSDTLELLPLLRKSTERHSWLKPEYALADKGYDSTANFKGAYGLGITPIIDVRRDREGSNEKPLWNTDGVPFCLGGRLMEYLGSDPVRGHQFRCPLGGCHLQAKKETLYCQDKIWLQPEEDLRKIGKVLRATRQWKALYGKRAAVERVNSRLKETRRLEKHCFRGLVKATLHGLLSVLTMQASALAMANAGGIGAVRQCLRKVA